MLIYQNTIIFCSRFLLYKVATFKSLTVETGEYLLLFGSEYFAVDLCLRFCQIFITLRNNKPAEVKDRRDNTFGLWTRLGPMNHVLDGDPDPHGKRQIRGKGGPL